MKKFAVALGIGVSVLLCGCATKQYPQLAPVSAEEARLFDCHTIELEIAKAESVRAEIDEIGSFDGRTALGVLGDFGVGNGMAKSEAINKAETRLRQLRELSDAKSCTVFELQTE